MGTDKGQTYLANCLRNYDGEKETEEFQALFHLYRQNELGNEKKLYKLCEGFAVFPSGSKRINDKYNRSCGFVRFKYK